MDVHTIDGGVEAAEIATAQRADVETQDVHGVNYLRYWVDEARYQRPSPLLFNGGRLHGAAR